jgi:hypothetical protein
VFQAEATPRELLVAGLAAVGALYVLVDLLKQLDRLRMAGVTIDELAELPTTEHPHEPPLYEGGPPND